MQQNQWDYAQQNCDWAALESFKCNFWVLIVNKVVLSNQKTQVHDRSVATKLSKNTGSPNLSLSPLAVLAVLSQGPYELRMLNSLALIFSMAKCTLEELLISLCWQSPSRCPPERLAPLFPYENPFSSITAIVLVCEKKKNKFLPKSCISEVTLQW